MGSENEECEEIERVDDSLKEMKKLAPLVETEGPLESTNGTSMIAPSKGLADTVAPHSDSVEHSSEVQQTPPIETEDEQKPLQCAGLFHHQMSSQPPPNTNASEEAKRDLASNVVISSEVQQTPPVETEDDQKPLQCVGLFNQFMSSPPLPNTNASEEAKGDVASNSVISDIVSVNLEVQAEGVGKDRPVKELCPPLCVTESFRQSPPQEISLISNSTSSGAMVIYLSGAASRNREESQSGKPVLKPDHTLIVKVLGGGSNKTKRKKRQRARQRQKKSYKLSCVTESFRQSPAQQKSLIDNPSPSGALVIASSRSALRKRKRSRIGKSILKPDHTLIVEVLGGGSNKTKRKKRQRTRQRQKKFSAQHCVTESFRQSPAQQKSLIGNSTPSGAMVISSSKSASRKRKWSQSVTSVPKHNTTLIVDGLKGSGSKKTRKRNAQRARALQRQKKNSEDLFVSDSFRQLPELVTSSCQPPVRDQLLSGRSAMLGPGSISSSYQHFNIETALSGPGLIASSFQPPRDPSSWGNSAVSGPGLITSSFQPPRDPSFWGNSAVSGPGLITSSFQPPRESSSWGNSAVSGPGLITSSFQPPRESSLHGKSAVSESELMASSCKSPALEPSLSDTIGDWGDDILGGSFRNRKWSESGRFALDPNPTLIVNELGGVSKKSRREKRRRARARKKQKKSPGELCMIDSFRPPELIAHSCQLPVQEPSLHAKYALSEPGLITSTFQSPALEPSVNDNIGDWGHHLQEGNSVNRKWSQSGTSVPEPRPCLIVDELGCGSKETIKRKKRRMRARQRQENFSREHCVIDSFRQSPALITSSCQPYDREQLLNGKSALSGPGSSAFSCQPGNSKSNLLSSELIESSCQLSVHEQSQQILFQDCYTCSNVMWECGDESPPPCLGCPPQNSWERKQQQTTSGQQMAIPSYQSQWEKDKGQGQSSSTSSKTHNRASMSAGQPGKHTSSSKQEGSGSSFKTETTDKNPSLSKSAERPERVSQLSQAVERALSGQVQDRDQKHSGSQSAASSNSKSANDSPIKLTSKPPSQSAGKATNTRPTSQPTRKTDSEQTSQLAGKTAPKSTSQLTSKPAPNSTSQLTNKPAPNATSRPGKTALLPTPQSSGKAGLKATSQMTGNSTLKPATQVAAGSSSVTSNSEVMKAVGKNSTGKPVKQSETARLIKTLSLKLAEIMSKARDNSAEDRDMILLLKSTLDAARKRTQIPSKEGKNEKSEEKPKPVVNNQKSQEKSQSVAGSQVKKWEEDINSDEDFEVDEKSQNTNKTTIEKQVNPIDKPIARPRRRLTRQEWAKLKRAAEDAIAKSTTGDMDIEQAIISEAKKVDLSKEKNQSEKTTGSTFVKR